MTSPTAFPPCPAGSRLVPLLLSRPVLTHDTITPRVHLRATRADLLVALAFSMFAQPVTDIGGRNSVVATYFLAAAATLYVVSSFLPATDYLTLVDMLVVITLGVITLMGIDAILVYTLIKTDVVDETTANTIDKVVAAALAVSFIVANVYIFSAGLSTFNEIIPKLTAPRDPKQPVKAGELPSIDEGELYIPYVPFKPPPPKPKMDEPEQAPAAQPAGASTGGLAHRKPAPVEQVVTV